MSEKIKKELTHEEANNFCVWLQDELAEKEQQLSSAQERIKELKESHTEDIIKAAEIVIKKNKTIDRLREGLLEAIKEMEGFDLMILGDELYAGKVARLKVIAEGK